MVQSGAKSVEAYLKELPPERREAVAAVRALVLDHLPAGYVEAMRWGMICYEIPLERYPETYNGQPLAYVALAAQKNHYSVYLNGVYADSSEERALRDAFAAAGKKLDIGKSCVRFRKLADLELPAIARAVASTPPDAYIARYEASRRGPRAARG
ncbi:MAG: hypothetical protein AMXMBFR36_33660 [Acidobacteriota bacterium]